MTPLSDERHGELLRAALAFLEKNESVRAEPLLQELLAARPKDPDALQLMGLFCRDQGRTAEAEDFYRRSLAEKPDQPHVQHNLGNVLSALGRFDEAIAPLREAIRLKPDYVKAHLNLGKALAGLGQFAAAEKSYRKALWLRPGDLFAMQSLGAVLNDLGRPREAEIVLHQALAAGSHDGRQVAALEHNLGVSFNLQRRYSDALVLFDSAQRKVPDMPLADYNRGNALQHLGRFDEAIDCYRRTIAREPLNLSAHRDLNQLLYRLGRDDEFLTSYDEAALLFPDQGELVLAKALFQFQRDDFEAARDSFVRAAAMLPHHVMPRDGLGLVHARLNAFDDACREHEAALRMEPQNGQAWRNYGETLLRAGDATKALDAADHALAIDPSNQSALAIRVTALELLGDERAQDLIDYANFVQVFELEPPADYDDMDSFNRDLSAVLDDLHLGKREFLDQTLRGGTQTLGNLFGERHRLIEALRGRIDEAVGIYISRLKNDENHPLLGRKRKLFDYSASWSSRLHDCGFHTNHVHPKGWISSAYYAALPDCISDETAKQGWIKFGEPAFDTGGKTPVHRFVQPRAGTLVLFPSYMWHGTVPFRSQQSRTTIAFDVVPR